VENLAEDQKVICDLLFSEAVIFSLEICDQIDKELEERSRTGLIHMKLVPRQNCQHPSQLAFQLFRAAAHYRFQQYRYQLRKGINMCEIHFH